MKGFEHTYTVRKTLLVYLSTEIIFHTLYYVLCRWHNILIEIFRIESLIPLLSEEVDR